MSPVVSIPLRITERANTQYPYSVDIQMAGEWHIFEQCASESAARKAFTEIANMLHEDKVVRVVAVGTITT